MKTPLARQNLLHYKMRTLAGASGVAFSVVLIFLQLGFLGSVHSTAALLFDGLEFDLMLRSPQYLHVAAAHSLPRDRVYQAASEPDVRGISTLCLGVSQWHHPKKNRKRRILVIAVPPEERVFVAEEIRQKSKRLVTPESILVDRQSRKEFGPVDGRAFGDADIGTQVEVGGRMVRIVGHFSLGGGFAADGVILVNMSGYNEIDPAVSPDHVSLGLIRLARGVDAEPVAARMNAALPRDVEVLTRDEAVQHETKRWIDETSLGVIFRLGVWVSLVVGTAIVYQVLSSDVAQHLSEYATLKAMGYSPRFLAGLVLRQALALAILGFVPGLIIAEVLYRVTASIARIPIEMNLLRIVLVLTLALLMCTLSGLGATRKLRSADPADLF
jgi:putative ABC transport system permease protein